LPHDRRTLSERIVQILSAFPDPFTVTNGSGLH
jgi:hypothetical protein